MLFCKFDELDKLYCKFDELDNLYCKFDELAKLHCKFNELDKLYCKFDELAGSRSRSTFAFEMEQSYPKVIGLRSRYIYTRYNLLCILIYFLFYF